MAAFTDHKSYFKPSTDTMFQLYEAFKESGFTDDQAFELTSCYVRQSIFDNMVQHDRKTRSRSALREAFTNKEKDYEEV